LFRKAFVSLTNDFHRKSATQLLAKGRRFLRLEKKQKLATSRSRSAVAIYAKQKPIGAQPLAPRLLFSRTKGEKDGISGCNWSGGDDGIVRHARRSLAKPLRTVNRFRVIPKVTIAEPE
jgi:hypothetical protein